MIRVLIADDQPIVRAGLTIILSAEADIEVVGEAADGDEAVRLTRELRPDVVCMDLRMPVLDGIRATRLLIDDPSITTDVLVVTTFDLDADVFAALEAGAAGFLLKGADADTLIAAIRSVAAGDGTLDQRLTRRVLREFAARTSSDTTDTQPHTSSTVTDAGAAETGIDLTARERDVLTLLGDGLSNAEIGTRLHVETTTVKYHLAGLMQKTATRDRLQLVLWGIRHGVVEPPTP